MWCFEQSPIGVDHDADQFPEAYCRLPSKQAARFRSVRLQAIDLGGPEVARIDDHVIPPVEPDLCESKFHEFFYRMGFSRADNIVVRPILLKHEPHSSDVVRRVSPVAFCLQI